MINDTDDVIYLLIYILHLAFLQNSLSFNHFVSKFAVDLNSRSGFANCFVASQLVLQFADQSPHLTLRSTNKFPN